MLLSDTLGPSTTAWCSGVLVQTGHPPACNACMLAVPRKAGGFVTRVTSTGRIRRADLVQQGTGHPSGVGQPQYLGMFLLLSADDARISCRVQQKHTWVRGDDIKDSPQVHHQDMQHARG